MSVINDDEYVDCLLIFMNRVQLQYLRTLSSFQALQAKQHV